MTRLEWLHKKHKELDGLIAVEESHRQKERKFDHKATLIDLKKQKLAIKQEIEKEKNNEITIN